MIWVLEMQVLEKPRCEQVTDGVAIARSCCHPRGYGHTDISEKLEAGRGGGSGGGRGSWQELECGEGCLPGAETTGGGSL